MFSPSHLSPSTLRSVPAWIMTCQCFRSSAMISVIIWFLAISSFTRSRHLNFRLPRFRFPSTVIRNIFLVPSSLSRLCTCPNHLNLFSLRNYAIGYMCASFQMSTFRTLFRIYSRLSSCLTQHAHFSHVQFPLLLSNCPTFCSIHHGRFYSRLVHFVFQLCWYGPVAHHPSSFLPLWPGNLYSVVYIILGSSVGIEHWAQILERFHCLYFFFLNVDSLVFFWAWHILYMACFSSAYS